MENEKCLIDGCHNKAEIRRVCRPCYYAMRRMVKREETTLEELIKAGMIAPKTGRCSVARRALAQLSSITFDKKPE